MIVPGVGVLKVRAAGKPGGPAVDVYFEPSREPRIPVSLDPQVKELRKGISKLPSAAAAEEFQNALERVMPAAEAIIGRIRSSVVNPSEATLEFGIKLAGKIGIPIIANGEAEAHFVVTLGWKRDQGEGGA